MRRNALVLAYSLAALAGLTACGGGDGGGLAAVGCSGLGTDQAEVKTQAFVRAANRFQTQSATVANRLHTVCTTMAQDMGVAVQPPRANQQPVEASCGSLAAGIDAIRTGSLSGGASLSIQVQPAECYIEANATAQCVAMCDPQVMAMGAVRCTSGSVRGQCMGECMGRCHAEGSVMCAMECRGTCNGRCMAGECNGSCDGMCAAKDGQGRCVGACSGMCNGTCTGECVGTCTGNCVSNVMGTCMTTCEGSCSVEFMNPSCTGGVTVTADRNCEAACEAELNAQAVCTEPSVRVTSAVDLMADPRLANYVSTLQRNWPEFLAAMSQVQKLGMAGQAFVTATSDLSGAIQSRLPAAYACLAGAALKLGDAVTNVQASVSVSIQVEASVRATAGP